LGEAASFFKFKLGVMVDGGLMMNQQTNKIVVVHGRRMLGPGFTHAENR
jgi:hypothetical protein